MFIDFYHSFYYSLLIMASVISLLFFKRADKTFKWLAVLIMLTLISELVAKYISFSLHRSNAVVYHIFTPVEYFLYACIYKNFRHSKKWDRILVVSIGLLVGIEILNTIFFQPLQASDTNTMIVESVFLVFLSLNLFIKISESPVYKNLLKEGVFWFNCAVLCYYSFNILIWGFHSIKVYQLKYPPRIIYDINLLFSGLLYISYVTSILLNAAYKRKFTTSYE